jgi:hypothetical protein
MIWPVPMPAEVASLPFRWDLVAPDRLGSLLAGTATPDLWFLDALAQCAGKVLARSGDGDLVFVGRSLDSMFDLLGGALPECGPVRRRLPFSFARPASRTGTGWRSRPLSAAERAKARDVLAALSLTPADLARRARPVVFVDVVYAGSTFTELYGLLRDWIDEDRGQWDVIRRKLRFLGVIARGRTSPNTWRWQQHVGWTRQLPADAVRNVSLDGQVWKYLGNNQAKLTASFTPQRWLAEPDGPGRSDDVRQALAEAVAVTRYGRGAVGRRQLARATEGEPALSQPWLRYIVRQLNQAQRAGASKPAAAAP